MTVRLTVDVASAMRSLPAEAWRNGSGWTRTVAEGSASDRRWRVSIATVTDGAPFSVLPGVDRVFLPLGPGTIALHGPAGRLPADPDGTVRFDGAFPVTADVPGGSAQALNVMTTTGTHQVDTILRGGTVVVHLEPQETP